ncbi:MAG: glycosyltransferase family 1 protein, partial [Pseudomonadales bacterium]|nr:glycosyltransferase family 1 protein [Pseudomonadales bacterium]
MPRSHKVVHLVRRFVFNEWGGTEAVVWNSALGLLEQGTPTSILATSALDEQGTEIRQGCHIERFSYHYPRLGLNRAQRQALDKKGGNPYS